MGAMQSVQDNLAEMATRKSKRPQPRRRPIRALKSKPNSESESSPKSEPKSQFPAPPTVLPTTGKSLLHLPVELLQLICESLVSPAETETTSGASSAREKELRVNRSQLLNFGLTCKATHGVSHAILYGHLTGYHYTSTWKTFQILIRSLDSNPHLSRRIRSIDFRTHAFPNMESTLKALPEESLSIMKRLFRQHISSSWVSGDPLSHNNVHHIFKYRVQLALLLVNTPDLRRAKITICKQPNSSDTLNQVTLKSKLSLPRLTELELCSQWDDPAYPFKFSHSLTLLEAAPNLTTLVINNCQPVSISLPINLPNLQTLIITGGDMVLSPDSIRGIMQASPQLRHFQIDFFDHKRDFNIGSKYIDDPWHRYFTKARVDGRLEYNPPQQKRAAADLYFSCATATHLVSALGPAASALESICIGLVSDRLEGRSNWPAIPLGSLSLSPC